MKKILFSLMVMFGATVVSNNISAQVDNGAKISFTKETHDYGTIKNGDNIIDGNIDKVEGYVIVGKDKHKFKKHKYYLSVFVKH